MSILQATSAGVKDMADQSLRITFEFEPRDAAEAFALFGKRGSSCALAALTQAATIKVAQQEAVKADPIGPLCKLACQWCKDPKFWDWIDEKIGNENVADNSREQDAKAYILEICQVVSRKHLDTDSKAAQDFHRFIRQPFISWMAA